MKKHKIDILLLIIIVSLLMPCLLHAQGPGFGNDVTDDVPIDGGLSLLVAAGVGYGIKKVRRKQNDGRITKH